MWDLKQVNHESVLFLALGLENHESRNQFNFTCGAEGVGRQVAHVVARQVQLLQPLQTQEGVAVHLWGDEMIH